MTVQYLHRDHKPDLAYVYTPGDGPVVVFLGGYRSDMNGTKATYFETQCKNRGQAYLRLDYGGHGQSGGQFDDGTIGAWADDAAAIIQHVLNDQTPVVLVGSSMGGWMMFLVARRIKTPIKALIGIAAAPDFTEDIYARLTDDLRDDLHTQGYAMVPNDYSDQPYRFSKNFYEEAKAHMVLNGGTALLCPIHLVQGMNDKDVLPDTPDRIKGALPDANIKVTYVEDGDHRLSRPEDLRLIDGIIINQ